MYKITEIDRNPGNPGKLEQKVNEIVGDRKLHSIVPVAAGSGYTTSYLVITEQ